MADPPRLRSNAGSLEALLLRSARNGEPPPEVEDEVWRRVQIVTAAGAAIGATGIAVQTAAVGSKVVKGAVWLSVLKWGAVVAIGVPVAGAAAHWAVHRAATPSAVVAKPADAPRPVAPSTAVPVLDPPGPVAVAVDAPVVVPDLPRPAPLAPRGHSGASTASTLDAPSALRKESLSLGAARAKFAAGDPRGALDDVTRLGVEVPHGRLVQEREVLAMDSLVALGDGDAARTRARAFLVRFPASPYLAHVRQLAER